MLYGELINIYKKEYKRTFKTKDKDWRIKHDYKSLKGLDYHPDQPQQLDQLILPTCVKITKSRFNEIKSIITNAKNSGLSTKLDDEKITIGDAEIVVKDIASKKK